MCRIHLDHHHLFSRTSLCSNTAVMLVWHGWRMTNDSSFSAATCYIGLEQDVILVLSRIRCLFWNGRTSIRKRQINGKSRVFSHFPMNLLMQYIISSHGQQLQG
ncbi:uncharacterized protein [Coffea arabica]|uniref:Uncharacterized protein n=1 Tax=Coffea arabica TaxID=13443 RepID=A0ABM4X4I4_COFAR